MVGSTQRTAPERAKDWAQRQSYSQVNADPAKQVSSSALIRITRYSRASLALALQTNNGCLAAFRTRL